MEERDRSPLSALTIRLDRLEAENRRWRRGAGILLGVGLAIGLLGQTFPPDPSSDAGTFPDGTGMILLDEGPTGTILDVQRLYFTDARNERGLLMGLSDDGQSLSLRFMGHGIENEAELRIWTGESPGMRFVNSKGRKVFEAR
jgi:hypothetical protein